MHNSIPASRSYFSRFAFAGSQAAMMITLRAISISRNRVGRVRHTAAGCLHSDPKDERIPIGPGDVISMHRRGAGVTQAPGVVDCKPGLYALDVLIAGIVERTKRQIDSLIAQCHVYSNLIIHGGIFHCRGAWGYSLFPVVDFVHTESYASRNNKTSSDLRSAR